MADSSEQIKFLDLNLRSCDAPFQFSYRFLFFSIGIVRVPEKKPFFRVVLRAFIIKSHFVCVVLKLESFKHFADC